MALSACLIRVPPPLTSPVVHVLAAYGTRGEDGAFERQLCFLKWDEDRVTDVTFEKVFKLYQLRADMTDTFCVVGSVKERLNGEVLIPRLAFESIGQLDAYVRLCRPA